MLGIYFLEVSFLKEVIMEDNISNVDYITSTQNIFLLVQSFINHNKIKKKQLHPVTKLLFLKGLSLSLFINPGPKRFLTI